MHTPEQAHKVRAAEGELLTIKSKERIDAKSKANRLMNTTQ